MMSVMMSVMKVGEAAVSTYFRRLKTQFYMGISSFLLGKRPVFFLVGFQNDIITDIIQDPCHRKTAFSKGLKDTYLYR